MGFLDKLMKKNNDVKPDMEMLQYLYSESELEEVDKYIGETFGEFPTVLHEIVSPDIHLDVCVIPPTNEEPYYKLVTMGAGAYKMNVPEQWQDYNIEYAEYVICLPQDWNIQSKNETDYWPIRVLKNVARLPIWCDTWLAFGHTTQADEEGTAYASNTRFNSVVLDRATDQMGDIRLKMSSGKVINFYQIVPLYPEELKFKLENNAEALFDRLNEKGIPYKVVDINRNSFC